MMRVCWIDGCVTHDGASSFASASPGHLRYVSAAGLLRLPRAREQRVLSFGSEPLPRLLPVGQPHAGREAVGIGTNDPVDRNVIEACAIVRSAAELSTVRGLAEQFAAAEK